MGKKSKDPATHSNYDEVVVSHYALEWAIDFENKRIVGSAELNLNVIAPTDKIVGLLLKYLLNVL